MGLQVQRPPKTTSRISQDSIILGGSGLPVKIATTLMGLLWDILSLASFGARLVPNTTRWKENLDLLLKDFLGQR